MSGAPHLGPKRLQRALRRKKLPGPSRERWVRDLALGCERCWSAIERAARSERLVGSFPELRRRSRCAVQLALARAVEVVAASPLASEWEALREPFRELHPLHFPVLRHLRELPLGFARLVLEEARHFALLTPAGIRAGGESLEGFLEDPRLAEAGEEAFRDLAVRAVAYLASGLVEGGRFEEAREPLDQTWSELPAGAKPLWRALLAAAEFKLAFFSGEPARAGE